MPEIVVTPEAGLEVVLAHHGPSHAVCFGSPTRPALQPGAVETLTLTFHDIAEPRADHVAPNEKDVCELVAFARLWDGARPLVLQCWLGVSRSAAGALIAGAARGADAMALARQLRAASPSATPNPLMLALADEALDLEGTLVAAGRAIGRGKVPVARPFVLVLPS